MNIKLPKTDRIKIHQADDLFYIMQRILMRDNKIDPTREHFWVVGLKTNSLLLFIELISIGTADATLVEPTEVFSMALQKKAYKIMLVHNHPAGRLEPSESDKNITDHLIQVGKIVKTPVVEHLIITETSYFSFAGNNLIEELEKSTKYVPPYKLQQQLKQEAKELGESTGKKKKAIEMAKLMKADGAEIELIEKYTGLSKKQIKNLD